MPVEADRRLLLLHRPTSDRLQCPTRPARFDRRRNGRRRQERGALRAGRTVRRLHYDDC